MSKLKMSGVVAVIVIMALQPASAYLDPGTGSMLLQGLVAAIAAGLMVVKLYWYKIKTFLFRRADKAKSHSNTAIDNVAKEDDGH